MGWVTISDWPLLEAAGFVGILLLLLLDTLAVEALLMLPTASSLVTGSPDSLRGWGLPIFSPT